jgi:hypothetical protein
MIVRSVRRLGTSDAHVVTGHRRVAAVLVISQVAGCAALLFLAQLAIRVIAVVPYPPITIASPYRRSGSTPQTHHLFPDRP